MNDLLTTRQVQDILKVDRITVYRMLQDGRLKGVKIGQQWRFHAREVNRLLADAPAGEIEAGRLSAAGWLSAAGRLSTAGSEPHQPATRGMFPAHCVQVIQDLYAGMGKIGAITVDAQGSPLTEPSQDCRFCTVIYSSPSGLAASQQCWQDRILQDDKGSGWLTCGTGLSYHQAAICENGQPVAYLITGPIYQEAPNPQEQEQTITQLAIQHNLNPAELLKAAREIPICDAEKRREIESWPVKFTQAIESILNERAGLVNKLQKIAEISMH